MKKRVPYGTHSTALECYLSTPSIHLVNVVIQHPPLLTILPLLAYICHQLVLHHLRLYGLPPALSLLASYLISAQQEVMSHGSKHRQHLSAIQHLSVIRSPQRLHHNAADPRKQSLPHAQLCWLNDVVLRWRLHLMRLHPTRLHLTRLHLMLLLRSRRSGSSLLARSRASTQTQSRAEQPLVCSLMSYMSSRTPWLQDGRSLALHTWPVLLYVFLVSDLVPLLHRHGCCLPVLRLPVLCFYFIQMLITFHSI